MLNNHGCLDGNLYQLDTLSRLPSPCLVIYQRLVEENLAIIGRELEATAPQDGFKCLLHCQKVRWQRVILELFFTSFDFTPFNFCSRLSLAEKS